VAELESSVDNQPLTSKSNFRLIQFRYLLI